MIRRTQVVAVTVDGPVIRAPGVAVVVVALRPDEQGVALPCPTEDVSCPDFPLHAVEVRTLHE